MAFNHYAKIKRILDAEPSGWYIKRIDEPTTAKNFRGETVEYSHYYRIYSSDDQIVRYGKFQKIDKLASILSMQVEDLPIVN